MTAIQKTSKPKTSRKKIILTALLLILVVGTAAFLIHRNQEQKRQAETLAADKATFATVEQEMANAYSKISKLTGKPVYEKISKGCSRSEFKFSQGSLSCTVKYIFIYPEQDGLSANLKVAQINEALSSGQLRIEDSGLTGVIEKSATFSTISSDLISVTMSACRVDVEYSSSGSQSFVADLNGKPMSQYSIVCSKQVETPVYPLAE